MKNTVDYACEFFNLGILSPQEFLNILNQERILNDRFFKPVIRDVTPEHEQVKLLENK